MSFNNSHIVDFITDTAVVFDILINETLHVFYFRFCYKCNCCLMNVKKYLYNGYEALNLFYQT